MLLYISQATVLICKMKIRVCVFIGAVKLTKRQEARQS